MDVGFLEQLMYQLSGWFMAPVLIVIAILFMHSLYALGGFTAQWWQRRKNMSAYKRAKTGEPCSSSQLQGYSLMMHAVQHVDVTIDELDIMALKDLEVLRIITRIAPMLGLIATMIPMAPALKALGDGNVQGISENLVIAFSAVIFGMVISSITFWLASVKKRWLAVELVDISKLKSSAEAAKKLEQDLQEELVREVA
jgi:biopolymer transport protein ExbB/TolQ